MVDKVSVLSEILRKSVDLWINPLIASKIAWNYLDVDKKAGMKLLYKVIKRRSNGYLNAKKFESKYGFMPPKTFIVNPTSDCQLSCKGCSTLSERTKAKGTNLDYETLASIVQQGDKIGVFGTVLMGGEPLFSSKQNVLRLIDSNPDHLFLIFTNGIGLDEQSYQISRKNLNVYWQLSLNGLKSISDSMRGEGSFDHVERAINELKYYKIPFGLSITVTKDNWKEVSSSEFFKFLDSTGSLSASYYPYGPFDGNLSNMPTIEEKTKFNKRLYEKAKISKISVMNYATTVTCSGGCRAGKTSYYITSKGDVSPCFAIGFSFGSIYKNSLEEIITSYSVNEFSEIRNKNPNSCIVSSSAGKILELAYREGLDEFSDNTRNISILRRNPNIILKYLG